MKKKALITGITGQDGPYLCQILNENGYDIVGVIRRQAERYIDPRKQTIYDQTNTVLVNGDITDFASVCNTIRETKPDEIYNLAAQSFVGISWSIPQQTMEVNGSGALNVFEAARIHAPDAKIYQASSSELYGMVKEVPQNEDTPFHPRSPYGVSKLAAHWSAINYRESYDMFIVCGILFNHESKLRGKEFVTRKITDAVARIKLGLQSSLGLGNLDSQRDWGYSKDYMMAAYLMMQQNVSDNYVISTGKTNTIETFVKLAFESVNLDYKKYIYQDKQFMRPAEVDILLGDATKARNVLGWDVTVQLDELIHMMVQSDIDLLKN